MLDPGDEEVRARFVQLASALDKQAEATRTLGRAATASRDAAVRARIGADLGDLYRELGDVKKARASYQGVIEAADEEASLRAARALAALNAEPRDPRGLAAALARLSQIEPEESARLAATADLGRVAEEELADLPTAIAAYERLVGTPRDADAIVALVPALRGDGRVPGARGRPRTAGARASAIGRRRRTWRSARRISGRASCPTRAAALAAWQMYVATYGASREALARIVPLLEHEKRWDELATALAREAAMAPAAEQAGLFSRLGQLRIARLDDARGRARRLQAGARPRPVGEAGPAGARPDARVGRPAARAPPTCSSRSRARRGRRRRSCGCSKRGRRSPRTRAAASPRSKRRRSWRPALSRTRGARWTSRRAGWARRSPARSTTSRRGCSAWIGSRPAAT